jgi:hypothetical protein
MFWYLFTLCTVQSFIVILVASSALVSPFVGLTSGTFVTQYYPAGLELNIVNGEVTTNMPEPYSVPNTDPKNPTPQNFVVIDTQTQDPIAALQQYHTMLLVTKTALVTQKSDDGELRIIPLKNIKEFHLTQAATLGYLHKAVPFIVIAAVAFLVLIPVIMGFFGTLYYLLLLLVLALLTWLAAKLRKIAMGYQKAYVLSGYLLTLPILVGVLLALTPIGNKFLVLLGFFVIALIINLRVRKEIVPVDA